MQKPQLEQFTVTVSFQSHTDNAETAARTVHCDSVLPYTDNAETAARLVHCDSVLPIIQ